MATTPAVPAADTVRLQRHTVRLLSATQILVGIGVAMGVSVGTLLMQQLTGGAELSGVGVSLSVIGGAAIAIPVVRLTNARGRRFGLAFAYLTGTVGAVLLVVAIYAESAPLAFLGMFCFGGGNTANLQARYAATDLADPARRGRQLATVVWATTIGAVAGPLLMPLGDGFVRTTFGAPKYAGPFLVSALGFVLAGLLVWLFLRPDPLLVARSAAESTVRRSDRGLLAGVDALRGNPRAQVGMAAVALGHVVMVGVMVMTPVHIEHELHGRGSVETVVGVILSLHVAGMFAFSPIVGWASDRFGRLPVIFVGIALLVAACATAGTAGDGTPQLAVGLVLLGLGWSCTMVSGSALLTESVDLARRPSAQGLSDVTMGVAGALAGAASGVVMEAAGYSILALCSALTTVPIAVAALRARRA